MDIRTVLGNNADLQGKLFIRGFMLTTNSAIEPEGFPFYGAWKHTEAAGIHFWTHPLTGFHYVEKNGKTAFLFGHAYNSFTMEIDENKILERILVHYGAVDFYDYVDEITGVFVTGVIADGKIEYVIDPSGMQSGCCGTVNGEFYLSSHPQLIADLANLEMAPFVKELIAYKWYRRVMGPYLPADMTPFEELKRIVPDIAYTTDIAAKTTSHKRFYPLKQIAEVKNDDEYMKVICDAADILKNNMTLVLRKWGNPWQSLTGGIDSNTTFAAANGHYKNYHTFSYMSAPKEAPDVEAAEKISKAFNVPWTLYHIPEENSALDRFEEKKAILDHNNGYIAVRYDNETRKRMVLDEQCPADVEIKSWVSETIRCYWYKHYGRKSFPKLSAKLYRNLYKIFITNRALAHKVDKIFAKYIEDFEYRKIPSQYPPADIHYNEVTWGSWGGLNISEMKYCFDITFIYNNRRFLDLLFRVPVEKRISDQHHLDMKRYLNPELADMNIRVVNMKETNFRAFALNVIFTINCILPW